MPAKGGQPRDQRGFGVLVTAEGLPRRHEVADLSHLVFAGHHPSVNVPTGLCGDQQSSFLRDIKLALSGLNRYFPISPFFFPNLPDLAVLT